mmetsp:Transcript_23291/g.63109  ORF Transcript_23291/g.63109 Transcript_23291/m.63109 type:complete len:430 (-) Transcript_23291:1007-2296(-)
MKRIVSRMTRRPRQWLSTASGLPAESCSPGPPCRTTWTSSSPWSTSATLECWATSASSTRPMRPPSCEGASPMRRTSRASAARRRARPWATSATCSSCGAPTRFSPSTCRPSWSRWCVSDSRTCSSSSTTTSSTRSGCAPCSPRTTRPCPSSPCSRSCATTPSSSARPLPHRWLATRSASPSSPRTTAGPARGRAQTRLASSPCSRGCLPRPRRRRTIDLCSCPTTRPCWTCSLSWPGSTAGPLCAWTAPRLRRSAPHSSRSSMTQPRAPSSSSSAPRRAGAVSTSSAPTASSCLTRTGTLPTTSRRRRASGVTGSASTFTSTASSPRAPSKSLSTRGSCPRRASQGWPPTNRSSPPRSPLPRCATSSPCTTRPGPTFTTSSSASVVPPCSPSAQVSARASAWTSWARPRRQMAWRRGRTTTGPILWMM